MTDCAPYLNGKRASPSPYLRTANLAQIGYGVGARYDGTYSGSSYHGSCAGKSDISTWDGALKNDTRAFIETQLQAFEANTNGWVFWNFKAEAADEWDLLTLLDNGIFPNPVTNRAFGPACDSYYRDK